ncbi:lamin tail domain-containing protein [Fredinandcohnia salidurans]|uniref:Lamin tail domain-containing protein n=1 Tax=Fredinandcohnia salidurans TaxID=2595041 RepID=A0ABW4MQ12_9BACI
MRKKANLKKGLAVTTTVAILVSNLGLAVPSAMAEEASQIPISQVQPENQVQKQEDSISDSGNKESDVQDSPALPEEALPNENQADTEMTEAPASPTTETDSQPSEEETQENSEAEVSEPTSTSNKEEVEQTSIPEQPDENTTGNETEQTIEQVEEPIDYQQLPPLLITEIMPNNLGADDYEYFEVYNNTNQPIVLDHYTFSLRYTDVSGTPDVDMQFAPTTLAPKESMVFWHNSKQKTLADFNQRYQTSLTEDHVVEFGGPPNFYNSGNRAVVIKDHAGNDLLVANYLKDDIGDGLVVQYQYPVTGVEMEKLETKAQPTPGTIVAEQVPQQEVVAEENQAPIITHEQITTASAKEDLVISATITDDHQDSLASVYYQTEPDGEFKKLSMTQMDGQIYQATIPKESLTNETLRYYIEVTDTNHRVTFPEKDGFDVAIEGIVEPDYDSLPPILITEISPNSEGGGTDYYEYFELYNNTNQPQVLTNYSFIYHYTDTGKELPFQIPATTIEPQEKLVFWFNNGNKPLEDFNAQFGTELTNEQVVEFTDAFPGFANGGNRALVLKDLQGAEVISASYLGSDNDNTGAVIQYKYPDQGTVMKKLQGMAPPSPGVITDKQAPAVPVQLPEIPTDTEAPVIEHTQVDKVDAYTPVKIEAHVTDNLAIPLVTLHYKEKDAENFTAISMNPSVENTSTYSAEIPAASVTSDLIYYIEASDGVQAEKTSEYSINVKQIDIDYSTLPHLLVTEVVPDTTNVGSADGYEFIEIYNNSNQDINFKDYKIYYRYGTDPGTDVVWPSVPEDVTIPAGKTLVFWIINDQNGDSTVADFNQNYGSNLVENENIVRIYTGGMANGSMRGIVIGTNAHKEVALAYYNDVPNVDDTYADKGIVYGYPTDQTTQQIKLEIKDATPGSVEAHQVPREAVQIPVDTIAPVIDNQTEVTEIAEKDNIEIAANVLDDQEVKSVRLFYKISDQDEYQMKILQQDSTSGLFHSTIYSPELIGKDFVDYYFVASDGRNEKTSDTYRVDITTDHDQSSLRLNVKEDDIVTGDVILKGTSADDAPDNVSLMVDGTELTSDTYHSVERTAYFALDVNGLNTYFQNAVTMGEEVLYLMDKDWLTQWKTFSIPIEPNRLTLGNNTITVRSGNKASPFDLESSENRDDYDLKNVRLVLSDGTVLTDPTYNNPDQVLKMNDGNPFVDFHFTITNNHALSKTVKWDTTTVSDGEHLITVQDADETLERKVIVDNSAPTIETNLIEDKKYKGAFKIEGSAFDEIAGVESFVTTLDGEVISLPYETASSKLAPGEHKLIMTAVDKVGNQTEHIVHFSVVNENPEMPEASSPADGAIVNGDPVLKVKVTDPTNDKVDVTFYQGYKYDVSQTEHIRGYKNASDTEPPQTQVPAGEQVFTEEDIALVAQQDGQYLTNNSHTQFPYHRFDVKVDSSVDENDIVELNWKGKSLEGRKVSMYAWNHEKGDWELIDYRIAGEEDFELSGNVEVHTFVKDSKINVLVQDEIPSTPDEYDYSFVWMSDTQFYTESFPHIFDRQTQWIAENQDEMKIEYIFHTGDLVNVSTDESQWNYADQYMGVLDQHNIPYGVLAGNHDVNQVNNDYTDYYRYFGENRFENKPYYGGSYLNNRGHYDLISAGGNDYIMMYLGWGVTDEGIQWVNDVLAAHPDQMAILNFHEYLLATGTRHPLGEKLYNEIVVPNENVIAVLSGHYHEAQTLIDEIDDNGDGTPDRTVYQMLADYQAGPEGGQGYMRLLHFDQDNHRIIVNTYSPYLDDYNYYDTDAHPEKDEFIINLDLSAVEKQVATDYFSVNVYSDTEIGKDEDVESGEIAETIWKGLANGNLYSWYVVVEDDHTGKTVSDIWSFTKQAAGSDSEDENDPEEPPTEQPEQPMDEEQQPELPEKPESDNQDQTNNEPNKDQNEQHAEDVNNDQTDKQPKQNGDTLPVTATNIYNLLLAGFILLVAGGSLLVIRKRKLQA